MKLRLSKPFLRQYTKLPTSIRKKVDRQLKYLTQDLRHPSLVAKKMEGRRDIWEARVDYHHRLTFTVISQLIILRRVGTHDILRNP